MTKYINKRQMFYSSFIYGQVKEEIFEADPRGDNFVWLPH